MSSGNRLLPLEVPVTCLIQDRRRPCTEVCQLLPHLPLSLLQYMPRSGALCDVWGTVFSTRPMISCLAASLSSHPLETVTVFRPSSRDNHLNTILLRLFLVFLSCSLFPLLTRLCLYLSVVLICLSSRVTYIYLPILSSHPFLLLNASC